MTEITALISTLISPIVAIIVCMVNNHYQHKKSMALIEYRIDELTKQVKKHNNVIERTFKLETEVALLKEIVKE